MNNATTKASPQYTRDFELTVMNTSRGFNINVTSELIKDINTLSAGVLVEMKLNGNLFVKVFAYKINVCEFTNISKSNSLFRVLAANLIRSSKFQLNCPYKQVENSKIILKNFIKMYKIFLILQGGLYKIINFNMDDAFFPKLYNFLFRANLDLTDEKGVKIMQGIFLGSFSK